MPITITRKTTKTNIIRHLLLFVALICFIECHKKTDKQLEREILEIFNHGDRIDFSCDIHFNHIISMINNEEIKKFNADTLTVKLTKVIYVEIIKFYTNFPKKKIIPILDLIMYNITRGTESEYNNKFFQDAILYLIGIYINCENSDSNFDNFNEKIIPIAEEIIKENKIQILRKYIICFILVSKDKNFFSNLTNNKKLRELFINIVNRYISIETDEHNGNHLYTLLIFKFKNFYTELNINNNKSLKIVYFDIVDRFLNYYNKNLNNKTCYIYFEFFLDIFNRIFYNEEIQKIDLGKFMEFFEKIADIEINLAKDKLTILTFFIINYYFDFIPIDRNEHLIEFYKKFVTKVEELLDIISNYEINMKNNNFHIKNYSKINIEYYNRMEKKVFYNQDIEEKIIYTLQEYGNKIILFELKKIGYNVTKIRNNIVLNNFLHKQTSIYGINNLKKIFKDKVTEILKDQEQSENINLSNEEKIFLEFVFVYDFFDMDDEKNKDLILEMLKSYNNKILKSGNNVKDLEFLIILIFSNTNLLDYLNMDIETKENFLKNVNKFIFEKEIDIFIEKEKIKNLEKKEKGKESEKLFIIKFKNIIIDKDLKIIKNLEKFLNEEIFMRIMLNFIDNLKKLDDFYLSESNDYSKSRENAFKNYIDICRSREELMKFNSENKLMILESYWAGSNDNSESRENAFKNYIDIFYLQTREFNPEYIIKIPNPYWSETNTKKEIRDYFFNLIIKKNLKNEL